MRLYAQRNTVWFLALLPFVVGVTLPSLGSVRSLIDGFGLLNWIGLIGLQLAWWGLLYPEMVRRWRGTILLTLLTGLLFQGLSRLWLALFIPWMKHATAARPTAFAPLGQYAGIVYVSLILFFLFAVLRGVPRADAPAQTAE
jgi:hypothetical protein